MGLCRLPKPFVFQGALPWPSKGLFFEANNGSTYCIMLQTIPTFVIAATFYVLDSLHGKENYKITCI
jgi:hypothetical protein